MVREVDDEESVLAKGDIEEVTTDSLMMVER